MLLIGKSYTTECLMPVRVVDKEDSDVSVTVEGGSASVVWPVYLGFEPLRRIGHSARATISPQRARGGSFSWPDNFCCYSLAGGVTPVFDCDGTCGCGGCSTGDITYELDGYRFSYGGFFCSCPRDTNDSGEVDPTDPQSGPSVSTSFSKQTIIFESEYTNSVSDIVQRSSTDSELTCEVYGGTNGGHYAFMLYDGGRLLKKSGSNLPRSGTVAAREMFRIKIKYEAHGESAGVNDISAVGTFTENGGGTSLFSEATLTAVRVEVRPAVERTGYENRHRMGVRESFQVITHPSDIQSSIQCAQDWLPAGANEVAYLCPIRAASNGISMNIDGVPYTPSLSVIEPTGIICTNGYDVCAAGYTAMRLDTYVIPLDVCFSGLAVMEVPTTTVGPSGYFTNETFSSVWYHTKYRGAGEWHNIHHDNFFFEDTASFAEDCPAPHCNGTIDWEIVLGWSERNPDETTPYIATIPTRYHQIFTIDEHGDLRIDKFGQWIKQFASGGVTNSVGIINAGVGQ